MTGRPPKAIVAASWAVTDAGSVGPTGSVKRKVLPSERRFRPRGGRRGAPDELPGEGRPSPVPSARLPSVACLNSWKIVSSSSGAMPGPVSATAISTWPSSSRAETSTRPSAGVNLTALDSEVEDDLADATPVGADRDLLRLRRQRELDPRSARPFRVHRDRAAQHLRDRAPPRARAPSPGLDLGQVEHVVDQREQVLARLEHVVDVRRAGVRSAPRTSARAAPREKPMIAFSGVRSSCDIVARKSDLCRLAVSSSPDTDAAARRSSG